MTFMPIDHFGFLLMGAWGTVQLSALAFVGGGLIGLAVALARVSPVKAVRRIAAGYIQVIQGTPLLVLMGVCFFGPNIAGIGSVPAIVAAALAITIYASAFLGEIWRGCIQSVPRSQWEAAECLALTRWERMRRVILPQALRIATPPTVGFLVQIIKNTSIASLVVGYAELSYNAKVLNNSTFQPFLYFGCAVVLYFILCYPLSRWSRALERKLNAARG
ncbi:MULTISPECIES: amino acid ABC transporter permease [unclassified Variovorax]|jgi:polar amino acid transport system permease protein|uniref:amino acid ABC transporter permease n=1 Tax=Variovorax TaxID=34072 RepID=UPI00089CF765|nr:polar amino acid transport system permease protein [Variovorax boronicumulans]SDX72608.1 amino acid ABC transporter membrane protein 2, PAAT family [Variovorax sp. YR634]SDZ00929.1 amino acid ABC transporter membrane protein 2, PAAT family [Variovorax sp. YR266]SET39313.1 amino acid ABC transporter membrane protein 2, PAAT family [Variovorax sp. OV084]SOD22453.1 amino acid ABC transporter membrane protein 2, PAAT family [Variovorax sp. YR752]